MNVIACDPDLLPLCPGCGEVITPRYLRFGVCRNCYGTTDDPWWKERGGKHEQ